MLEADLSHGQPQIVEELDIPVAERKTLQDLTECMCRWPIGDPQQADFYFCGRNKVAGLPYCEHHARRAFQPPQPRRRDRDVSIPAMPTAIAAPKESADT
jgi:GcrA cell cycle regulator